MKSGIDFVLDSSALLALFFREAGEEFVRSVLYRSAVGAVNYSEVLSKLIQKGADPRLATGMLRDLQLSVLPFDEQLALEGADLASFAWTHGLSFADRACLALARRCGVPAVTADLAWKIPALPVDLHFIR